MLYTLTPFRRTFVLIILLLFILLPDSGRTQDESILSLNSRLAATPFDSTRVKLLNKIAARHLELNQLDKGIARAQEALALSDSLDYLKGKAGAIQTMGLFCCYNNDFGKAISFYNQSIDFYDGLGEKSRTARVMNAIGGIYHQMTNYDSALFHFYRSREILTQVGDSVALADTYNRIGLVFNSRGEYEEALENFMNSIQIYRLLENPEGMSLAFCHMGMVYRKLEDYEKAGEFLTQALNLNKQSGQTREIAEVYLQLGVLNKSIDQHEEAIRMFKKSLNLARYYNDQRNVAECLSQIGSVYHEMADYETALSFYRRAMNIQESQDIRQGMVQTSTSMAGAYLDMVEARRSGTFNDFSTSIVPEDEIFALLKKSIEMARESGNFNDLVSSYETLIRASATFLRYKDAVSYQKLLVRYRDSLEGIVRQQNIARLQADYERKQKEEEIILLNSDKKVQESIMDRHKLERYVYFGGGVSLIIVIFGLFNRLNFVRRTRNELQHRNKQIEEEKSRAEQSENVKEQFLAKMSHEIRIPMNTIMGSVNILLNGKHLKSQLKYLNAIYQSSENLMVIIDDILDLTKLQAGQIKLDEDVFNIREEVRNVQQIMQFKAREKGIDFKVKIADDVPQHVSGDSTRLNQVLINLAGNGIKFTEKGKVVISVEIKNVQDNIAQVLFSVTDTGIGIPEDRLDKIFKSFTQADSDTNRKYGGTGLGLTISKQLVELQKGSIYVESVTGKGSTFSFKLAYPIAELESKAKSPNTPASSEKFKGLRILVVEDDEFNIMVLKDTLSSALEDVHVDVAVEGDEAVSKWKENKFDIILMDIELPKMNGHEVTQAIRNSENENCNIPVIAMTANAMQHEVEACFASGMNDYIAKPFDPEELIIKINSNLINKVNS